MSSKNTRFSDQQLALLYTVMFEWRIEDLRLEALSVIRHTMGDSLAEEVAENDDLRAFIDIWILSMGLAPLLNIKEYRRSTIYTGAVKAFAARNELDFDWLMDVMDEFYADIRTRSEGPVFSLWLIDKLFNNAHDALLEGRLEMIAAYDAQMLPWAELKSFLALAPATRK